MLRLEVYYLPGFLPRTEEKRFLQDWCMEEAEEYIEVRQRSSAFKRAFIYLVHNKEQIEIRKYLPL
jgi:hypothetical protein